jgi:hypothetical protein
MSNAAVRDAIAKSVNRSLRLEGVIRADQLLRSYRRLISLLIEHDHIASDSELLKLVKLRMATKAGEERAALLARPAANVFAVDNMAATVVEVPVVAQPAPEAKPKRKSRAKVDIVAAAAKAGIRV